VTTLVREMNFGLLDDLTETAECACGLVYRIYPRARGLEYPYGYAAPVVEAGGRYSIVGAIRHLIPQSDDGLQHTRKVHWACPCGVLCSYVEALFTTVECTCGRAALRRNPPSDFYINPRYGMACACCGHSGVHMVPRAEVATWQCRRSW